MLGDFNLLVSTSRRNERKACNEFWYLLREAGDLSAEVEPSNISGLVVSKTSLDPVKAVEKLRNILLQKPWEFRYVLKVRPIQLIVPTDLGEIGAKAAELASANIADGESFRVTVEKRRSGLGSREIVEEVAGRIGRKVNLEQPDKIVLIEVLGDITGISVIPPEAILSVERERRAL
ncbi:MAG: THUMP domain-containing protein [Candidatus Bathyarchaeia archaeon]|nr:THUMP domain-containing protein [Candidatus Bathyarchaeota archaeon]